MKLRTFTAALLVITLLSGCVIFPRGAHGQMHVRGKTGDALAVGIGIGALAAGALAAPRYKPGHKLAKIPKGAREIHHHGKTYRYHDGVYFRLINGAYRVVRPPVGLVIQTLPAHRDVIVIDGETYYVAEGVYYYRSNDKYVVVEQPKVTSKTEQQYQAGHYYDELPTEAQPVTINNTQYFTYGGVFFLPQAVNGEVKYIVVELN